MNYQIIKNYRTDNVLRESFNRLAKITFGLDFEQWYKNGYWNDKYIPYSVVADGKVISNVSVNLIDCNIMGKNKRYIQLGTVMTDSEYRNRGYISLLMKKIMHDFSECDGFFLYANDSVKEFYPKFGFRKAEEFRFRMHINTENNKMTARHIPMENKKDWDLFLREKNKRKSAGRVKLDTDDLTMFYLTQYMKNNVYFLKASDCIVIAEKEGEILTVYDIFCSTDVDIVSVCSAFGEDIEKVEFAFTPENIERLKKYKYYEEDCTFFILGETIERDMKNICAFPAIAHA